MTPLPRHGEPAGDAYLAIQKLARATRADVQELLTLYALEGLVARLADSAYCEDFVLKGGVLLAAFSLRRPTSDIDWQVSGIGNDIDEVVARVREIAAVPIDDGLIFDADEMTARPIRIDDTYPGLRLRLIATLGRARMSVGVDVNFGDPIAPGPSVITLPGLIEADRRPIRLLGYPLAMVVAEKIVTALERGEANTRWRDFADVHAIATVHEMSAADLGQAIDAVATYRAVTLRALLPDLASMVELAQPKWAAWRRRHAYALTLPEAFGEVLLDVAALVDPVLTGDRRGRERWRPEMRQWSS